MKQIYHILCLLALATLGACQTGDDTNGQEENGQITIKFTAEPLTRTTLASSDNVQHVKYVQVYVFDGTEASAVCVASENVGWKQLQPGGTVTQYYTLKQKLDDGKTYTILAVGLDNDNNDNSEKEGSGYAYGLPKAIKPKTETEEGTTLGNAKATLAEDEGRTAADMNKAELFAGSNTVTVQPGANRITEITLKRRVAGVMAYFTNIPSDVERIQLKLYDNQYKDVPLIAQTSNDYGTVQADGSTVLLDILVNQEILKQEVVYASDGKTEVGTKLPGTVLQGAYMLPMPAPESGYTLTLVQIKEGEEIKQKNNLVLSNPASGSTGKNFPIEANVFYTIGRKDADHDEPYSLGDLSDGDYIYVDGNWQADVDIPM